MSFRYGLGTFHCDIVLARRQDRQCIGDVILRSVRANSGGGVQFLGRKLRCCKDKGKPQLGGNVATLVGHGNISLTINIARSERVAEYSTVVGTVELLKPILILVAASANKMCVKIGRYFRAGGHWYCVRQDLL